MARPGPSVGVAERASPTTSAPTATDATRPAGVNPSAKGAAISSSPPASSSTAWVGREMSRSAVMANHTLADWPVNFCEPGHTDVCGGGPAGEAGSVEAGGLLDDVAQARAVALG